ncbi:MULTISPECIES: hypothetical protein [Parachlamydia]|uniref:Uncharacterized protein n=1 Tax=Parachlamydia acanthamoebae (strain UV7) TaxID=765952 RepID=F8KXR4_PARAV|nr:hypothetical protein [Parachlamydia acanthamoebae]EFB41314.1 hypothetical protein pah_c045o005 [Parachlamydia acanthamoebae str. Hall's coccus]CCB85644.1 putative uncharacterized protein [Parachlamydia acanthamoebae UV-7]
MLEKPTISIQEFNKVEMAIGKVVAISINPHAKIPAYLLDLQFNGPLMGNKGFYSGSAQFTSNHTTDEIMNQQVACILNFPRKQIGSHYVRLLSDGGSKNYWNVR